MKNKFYTLFVILTSSFLFLSSCDNGKKLDKKDAEPRTCFDLADKPLKTLEHTKDNVIYEVNIRQFSKEGTFKAFEKHIPRLKEMGVDILWLMPVFPISEKNKKGTLGSYYAVADYKKLNPKFGNEDDFRSLIKTAHNNGMTVILDWVANHTGWDNPWITEHKDWYTQDSSGNVIPPVGTDWSDVADLNYDNKDMQAAMIDALSYWVKEFDVDGYRCDVAGMVPTEFWNKARQTLDQIKPVFMLAEAEQTDLHKQAFDMTYAWKMHHIMNAIAAKKQNADSLRKYFLDASKEYPKSAYRMTFTSNHDENSWNGTVFERMPKSYKTFAVLTFMVPGMPLIYNGQEAGLDKRLEFFEKDEIKWKDFETAQLYTKLSKIRKANPALYSGDYGGDIRFVDVDKFDQVFAMKRTKNKNTVLALFNLSDKPVAFTVKNEKGSYVDAFSGEKVEVTADYNMKFKAWEYKVLLLETKQ